MLESKRRCFGCLTALGYGTGLTAFGKMSFSVFIFIYTLHLAYLKVYTKFENTGFNRN